MSWKTQCYALEERIHLTWGWIWRPTRIYEDRDEANKKVTALGIGKDGCANAVVVVYEFIPRGVSDDQ